MATCPEHNRLLDTFDEIKKELKAGAVTMARLETRQAGVLWLLGLIFGAVLIAAVTGVWSHVYPTGRADVANAEATAHRDALNARDDARAARKEPIPAVGMANKANGGGL